MAEVKSALAISVHGWSTRSINWKKTENAFACMRTTLFDSVASAHRSLFIIKHQQQFSIVITSIIDVIIARTYIHIAVPAIHLRRTLRCLLWKSQSPPPLLLHTVISKSKMMRKKEKKKQNQYKIDDRSFI